MAAGRGQILAVILIAVGEVRFMQPWYFLWKSVILDIGPRTFSLFFVFVVVVELESVSVDPSQGILESHVDGYFPPLQL